VKLGDDFSEFMSEGYGGGIDGLRCSTCDHKYRGEAQPGQLCPQCKAAKIIRTTISNVLQAIEEEVWKKMRPVLTLPLRNNMVGQIISTNKEFNLPILEIVDLLKSARDSVK